MRKSKNCLTGVTEDFENLPIIKNIPAFNGVTDSLQTEDFLYDLKFEISKKNGLIQLKELPDLSVVYQQQTTSAVTGRLWQLHHEEFSNFLLKYKVKNIIEFGGAHGYLAQITRNKADINSWSIVDPVPSVEGDYPLVIKGFFDPKIHINPETDAVVSSHAIEHLTSPWQTISEIYQYTSKHTKFICSIPNLNVWLENCQPNSLNFEHTYLLGESHFEQLMSSFGYALIDKYYFSEHSIFYCFQKMEGLPHPCELDNRYEINLQLFEKYSSYYSLEVDKLVSKISKINYTKLYLFGAHLFSQFFISNGLCDHVKITGILDNNEDKHGKRLYGSNLICNSPNVLKALDRPLVVVKAGAYTDEISKQLLLLNPNCTIIN